MSITPNSDYSAPWWVRLLLAGLLLFGSEILLWTSPLERPLGEWLLIIPGYIAVSTWLLDLLIRYKLRDLLGLMTLAGLYGLLNGLLLNPATTLFDMPRTLVTRVTGAHTLLGLEMIFVFLALTGGQVRYLRRVLLIGAAVVGLAWGTWVRWSPEQTEFTFTPVSQEMMLLVGGLGIAILGLLTWQTYRRGQNITPSSLLLNPREYLAVALVFTALIFIRFAQEAVDFPSLFLITVVGGLCFGMLWFRRQTKLTPIAEQHFPIRRLSMIWLGLAVAILFWTGILTYNLPLFGIAEFNQLTFVVYGFTFYGLAWLPTVSLWLGIRAYIRQVQARPM